MPPPRSPQPRREQEAPHGGVQPPLHVQVASMLMQALVAIVSALTARTAHSERERLARARQRIVTPCLLDGCVCEEVLDLEQETRYWMCLEPVLHPAYATGPRVEKGGRWVHYVHAKQGGLKQAKQRGLKQVDTVTHSATLPVDGAVDDTVAGKTHPSERAGDEPTSG